MLKIIYSKSAIKFLDKNSNIITDKDVDNLIILAIKKIIKNENINVDVTNLKGYKKGFFRIRKGKIRIVFFIDKDGKVTVANVQKIDFRGDVYK